MKDRLARPVQRSGGGGTEGRAQRATSTQAPQREGRVTLTTPASHDSAEQSLVQKDRLSSKRVKWLGGAWVGVACTQHSSSNTTATVTAMPGRLSGATTTWRTSVSGPQAVTQKEAQTCYSPRPPLDTPTHLQGAPHLSLGELLPTRHGGRACVGWERGGEGLGTRQVVAALWCLEVIVLPCLLPQLRVPLSTKQRKSRDQGGQRGETEDVRQGCSLHLGQHCKGWPGLGWAGVGRLWSI
ncbi:hypothetical protein E2C01_079465 [Portunus trituberculatus]|uniref:Uncharacterized protein n=1 Tax=Portunus trituberculatus TaxID=210409 RepID=A0A5B7IVP8_PORTR|nr:hypothetical protein [Portunus trituberculatus]